MRGEPIAATAARAVADRARLRQALQSAVAAFETRGDIMKKLVLATVAASLLLSAPALATSSRPAPRLAHPTRAATPLVHRFFALIVDKNVDGLRRFLSPAFQVQYADGTSREKKEYLTKLAVIEKFTLTNLRATQAGGTLVVRYLADVTGVVNGRPYTPGPAPRLSVFSWNGRRWQLAAHANFNPLKG
jgi:Domain of unknown function (DUF4440)